MSVLQVAQYKALRAIFVSHDKRNSALTPALSALERNEENTCFKKHLGVLNVDFISFLTCFYEGKKIVPPPYFGSRSVALEESVTEGERDPHRCRPGSRFLSCSL